MTTSLTRLPPLPPAPGRVLLTDAGRAKLSAAAASLRATVLPELTAEMADRDRDRRVDADFHRLQAQLTGLDDLVRTAGSTRDRPCDGRIGIGDRVLVELPGRKQLEVLLSCEQEAALDEVRISVHSPLGKALSGAHAGDTVTVLSPTGDYPAVVLSARRE